MGPTTHGLQSLSRSVISIKNIQEGFGIEKKRVESSEQPGEVFTHPSKEEYYPWEIYEFNSNSTIFNFNNFSATAEIPVGESAVNTTVCNVVLGIHGVGVYDNQTHLNGSKGEGITSVDLWKGIPLGIVLSFLCLLTTLGNVLVLHAVRTEKRLQTVSTFLCPFALFTDSSIHSFIRSFISFICSFIRYVSFFLSFHRPSNSSHIHNSSICLSIHSFLYLTQTSYLPK